MKKKNNNQSARRKNHRPKLDKTEEQIDRYRSLASGEFEDASRYDDSAEGNPVVARNLLRLSAHLQVLAHLIQKGSDEVHVPSILEAWNRLTRHQKELPTVLREQLQLALDMLPIGLLQMNARQGKFKS